MQTESRRRIVPWLILALVAVAAAMPFFFVRPAPDIIAWRSDLDAARDAARDAGKPILLDFTADWCSYCQTMKQTVFSRDDVKQAIETRFVPVKLDYTHRNVATDPIARSHNIRGLPTVLALNSDGEEVGRLEGFADHERFMQWLASVE